VLAAWLKPHPSETETQSEIPEVRGLACRIKKLIKIISAIRRGTKICISVETR
jgi:hypothetical protein